MCAAWDLGLRMIKAQGDPSDPIQTKWQVGPKDVEPQSAIGATETTPNRALTPVARQSWGEGGRQAR